MANKNKRVELEKVTPSDLLDESTVSEVENVQLKIEFSAGRLRVRRVTVLSLAALLYLLVRIWIYGG